MVGCGKNKVILVTGGSGLIGQSIKNIVEDNEEEKFVLSSSKEADLRSPVETRRLFEKYRPTHVIHLAAMCGGCFDMANRNLEYLRENIQMNDNVLHNSYDFGVKKVVSCLSASVIPDQVEYPVNETMIHNGPPNSSYFGYIYAKRLMDVQNRAYHQKTGNVYTSVIPTNIFGPFDDFNLEANRVVPGLIHRAYIAKKEGKPLVVFGSGKPLRQFVYSIDVAKLILWVLRDYEEIDPIILSVDESDEMAITEVAQTIADAIQLEHGILHDLSKADGQYRKTVSNGKLRSYLPDFKFTPVKEAIHSTVEWFIQNYDSIRK